jgi:hypothetical protein
MTTKLLSAVSQLIDKAIHDHVEKEDLLAVAQLQAQIVPPPDVRVIQHHPREPISPEKLAYLDMLMEWEREKEKGDKHDDDTKQEGR